MPITGVMVGSLGGALAVIYALDCGFAVASVRRSDREMCCSLSWYQGIFAVAALLLAVGALGPAIGAWAGSSLLAGASLAGIGYVTARRLPFRLLLRVLYSRPRHPWPLDPVPASPRGVSSAPVLSVPLPALGTVVELNQN